MFIETTPTKYSNPIKCQKLVKKNSQKNLIIFLCKNNKKVEIQKIFPLFLFNLMVLYFELSHILHIMISF